MLAEQFAEGAKAAGNVTIYLLTTATENEPDFTPKRAESGLQGWIDCYGKSSLKGALLGMLLGLPAALVAGVIVL